MKQIQDLVSAAQRSMKQCNDSKRTSTASPEEQEAKRLMASKLWQAMAGIYGKEWISTAGQVPSLTQIQLVGSLSEEKIKRGLSECHKKIKSGNPWCPSVARFISMCESSDIDVDEAFTRLISNRGKPKNEAERRALNRCDYECRCLLESTKSRQKFTAELIEAYRIVGDAPVSEMVKIASKSAVTEVDKLVTERMQKHWGDLTPLERRFLEIKRNKNDK